MTTRRRILVVGSAWVVAAGLGIGCTPSRRSIDARPPDVDPVAWDRAGHLIEALPLYAQRADHTGLSAHRLRYAAALLRAGRDADARAQYDTLVRAGTESAGVCASSALLAGRPDVALPYARAAGGSGNGRLLLGRILVAYGDRTEAMTIARTLARSANTHDVGTRIEVARLLAASGDPARATRELPPASTDALAELFRRSAAADIALHRGDWADAQRHLAAARTLVPRELLLGRVGHEWRNAQREVWWVLLRYSLIRMRGGDGSPDVLGDLRMAARSDDAYVHAAATLLGTVRDRAEGHHDAADAELDRLAGHAPRFAEPIARFRDPKAPEVEGIAATLDAHDRSAATITQAVRALLGGSPQ